METEGGTTRSTDTLRKIVRKQLAELGEHRFTKVTCPCGQTPTLTTAARCLECGVWFCRRCAERHFARTNAVAAITQPIIAFANKAPVMYQLLQRLLKDANCVCDYIKQGSGPCPVCEARAFVEQCELEGRTP